MHVRSTSCSTVGNLHWRHSLLFALAGVFEDMESPQELDYKTIRKTSGKELGKRRAARVRIPSSLVGAMLVRNLAKRNVIVGGRAK